MRLLYVALGTWMVIHPVEAQSVRLRNVSYPYTAIEVGNTVEVDIWGAHPLATVQVVQNGGPPGTMGMTDELGNWSITATEAAENINTYTQYWYVDGVQMVPSNFNPDYVPKAPSLPNFTVYANFTGTSCSTQSRTNVCQNPNSALHWIWSPVTYYSTSSSVNFSTITAAAQNWNNIQNPQKLSLSSDSSARQDVWIQDDNNIGPYNARVDSYGQDCGSACYNLVDLCTGACFNAAAMYHAIMRLSIQEMNNAADAMGITDPATYYPAVVNHEFGHALRLADIETINGVAIKGICSEVQSVMYGSGSVLWGCGVRTPVFSCDASTINSIYPSAVGYCSTSQNNYCLVPSNPCS